MGSHSIHKPSAASGSGAADDLSYVTVSAHAGLTAERVLTGTANQVVIADNGANSTVVLSLPQSIAESSSPTFAGLTLKVGGVDTYSLTTYISQLNFRGIIASNGAAFGISCEDSDATDDVTLAVFATGRFQFGGDTESLRMKWSSANNAFQILSNETGAGTLRQLWIGNDVVPDAIIIQTSGDVICASNVNMETTLTLTGATNDHTLGGTGANPFYQIAGASPGNTVLNLAGPGNGTVSTNEVRLTIYGIGNATTVTNSEYCEIGYFLDAHTSFTINVGATGTGAVRNFYIGSDTKERQFGVLGGGGIYINSSDTGVLPAADPGVTGRLYHNSGTLMISL